jgi:hypothetical protein
VRAARAEAELRSVQERLGEEQAACSALKKQMGGWPVGGQQAAAARAGGRCTCLKQPHLDFAECRTVLLPLL